MTALTDRDRTDDRWDDGFIARSRHRSLRKGGAGARGGGPRSGSPGASGPREERGGLDGVDPDHLDDMFGEEPDVERREGDEALVRAVSGAGSDGGKAPALPLSPEARALRLRLDALRQLVGLSRTRLDGKTLAEAGRVLDEAAARRGLSPQHTVVAIAGATGSGKSTLFNSLAGVQISETGLRRPTTAAPIACSWSDGAAGLLDRLEIPGRCGAGPGRPRRPRRCAGWSSWTCPTWTRRSARTATTWTGCWRWSTPWCGWWTRRSTRTPSCTSGTCDRWPATRK